MSIRLDPRRLGTLKQLAGEAGMRPGDLVRTWVEERIDAARQGITAPAAAADLDARVAALAARVAALEGAGPAIAEPTEAAREEAPAEEAPAAAAGSGEEPAPRPRGRTANRLGATPRGERVALHDEMIAVLAERGPMTAGDLASAIAERGRYAPPRSGKPLNAAMVSQRVSNPTYRSRFTRDAGRIGLAESAG
ncbi:MAG: hypothetical protein ACLGI2_15200 [Acidimicrobiia bacterium]